MSNEYKDWERDRIEDEKQLIKIYPFLHARQVDGTLDTDSKFPMIALEIPQGWYRLFFQMCDELKVLLEKENLLYDFYFLQVKEKYNFLRCYCSNAPRSVSELIAKYEQMAPYICTVCGKPALWETTDYIASFCSDCKKDDVKANLITFEPFFIENGGKRCEKKISFKPEWTRYLINGGK